MRKFNLLKSENDGIKEEMVKGLHSVVYNVLCFWFFALLLF